MLANWTRAIYNFAMLSQEIRRKFLNYFRTKGHTVVPSSPVVPHDDPTLLFNNAGMNQFKDVFLGKSHRDYKRAASSQKCIRVGGKHNDLDNVGHTARHLTFFEMLGNFSFGDYFKKEAIAFAWDVTTEVFEFSPDKLWITIYEQDDEAFELWRKIVSENRIVRMGEKDNFWAMGDTGPCGPCSELYYDRGSKYGDAKNPREDVVGDRFIEFWNLVFMQFNRDATGKMTPLPSQSIDTGAGLERVMALKMGVDNVFHTDILRHIISQIERVTNITYDPADAIKAPAFHVIADHIRTLSFAITDGAQPSNVERGYVLRKLLRRAVRYGRSLNLQEPFLAKVLPALLETMGSDYNELNLAQTRISEILTLEEEAFIRTLKKGGNILNSIVEKAVQNPLKQISGEEAFKLKDTYGFPLEEILLIAKDFGLQVNIDAYQLLEEQAREKSRSSQVIYSQEAELNLFSRHVEKFGPSTFVGYTDLEIESEILAIGHEGQFIEGLSEGEKGWILLKETPFYAEKGGQVGDIGFITGPTGRFRVTDCQNPFPGAIVHHGFMEHGYLKARETVQASVDKIRRKHIACHHTATHLLHWALQQVLGPQIRQAGSLVAEDRLRFDFSHHKSLTPEEIHRVEDLVNEKIRQNDTVNTYEIPFEEAQKQGEIKQFFGEKYGKHVRVIDISYSKELCGGTHATHVGMIGYFRITKEGSVAAGVRRIEAVTGPFAEKFVREEEEKTLKIAQTLKIAPAKLPERIDQLTQENSDLKTELRTLKRIQLKSLAQTLSQKVEKIGSISAVIQHLDLNSEDLPLLAEELQGLLPSSVIILALKLPSQAQLLIKVTPDLIGRGIQAGALIKELAPLIGGGGGGKADSAQAGGKNPEGVTKALSTAKELLAKL